MKASIQVGPSASFDIEPGATRTFILQSAKDPKGSEMSMVNVPFGPQNPGFQASDEASKAKSPQLLLQGGAFIEGKFVAVICFPPFSEGIRVPSDGGSFDRCLKLFSERLREMQDCGSEVSVNVFSSPGHPTAIAGTMQQPGFFGPDVRVKTFNPEREFSIIIPLHEQLQSICLLPDGTFSRNCYKSQFDFREPTPCGTSFYYPGDKCVTCLGEVASLKHVSEDGIREAINVLDEMKRVSVCPAVDVLGLDPSQEQKEIMKAQSLTDATSPRGDKSPSITQGTVSSSSGLGPAR